MGRLHQNVGNVGEAIAAFQEAIRLDPARADLRLLLGQVFYRQGNLPEAAAVYREASQLEGRAAAKGLAYVGYVQRSQLLFRQALSTLKVALTRRPRDARIVSVMEDLDQATPAPG